LSKIANRNLVKAKKFAKHIKKQIKKAQRSGKPNAHRKIVALQKLRKTIQKQVKKAKKNATRAQRRNKKARKARKSNKKHQKKVKNVTPQGCFFMSFSRLVNRNFLTAIKR